MTCRQLHVALFFFLSILSDHTIFFVFSLAFVSLHHVPNEFFVLFFSPQNLWFLVYLEVVVFFRFTPAVAKC